MRKGYAPERFGRLEVSDAGWRRYTHLKGDERQVFMRLYKSPRRAFLLALLFGGFGAHRFYLGHWRVGAGILALWLVDLFVTPVWWLAVVVYLVELGHIVRTTEQWNDSLEGALMLQTYRQPLFKDAA